MDLWDRLCSSLRARVVSVEDVARKKSMELRLLLGVAHGVTWFGRWGYRFATGSYGIDHHLYDRSVHLLAHLNLDHLVSSNPSNPSNHNLCRIVHSYRRLRRSHPETADLYTVRDLLQFLFDIKRNPASKPINPKPLQPQPTSPLAEVRKKAARKRYRDFALVAAELASRWPVRRLCTVAGVVVDALRESGGKLTRQEVRDAARLVIGDTGLIDFVLKSLGNCVVAGSLIRRAPNPSTRVLEFSIVEIPDRASSDETELSVDLTKPGSWQVDQDIVSVYKALIETRPEETRSVLDCKHWVKTWELRDNEDDLLRFHVAWEPEDGEKWATTREPHPTEVVVVAAHAGVGELKAEAERALRDTYCVLGRFRVTGIEGIKGEDWDPVMLGGAESGATLAVRGVGADLGLALRYEGGANAWAVGCACGARDDDGERMVACDVCDVWHHTRCVGIRDGDPVPPLFLCALCGSSLLGAAAAPLPGSAVFRNVMLDELRRYA
ncbi:PHD Zn-finger proteins protein [Dioscorea alata]|uniref:PHD Zn-finger proteins protein n=1 Tax=Dioscorea alata TaxID=55571 RepID=A0ACB7U8M1_DIOAL|nr:PHD Zn-finger proteins protein [Dioscorea alata]